MSTCSLNNYMYLLQLCRRNEAGEPGGPTISYWEFLFSRIFNHIYFCITREYSAERNLLRDAIGVQSFLLACLKILGSGNQSHRLRLSHPSKSPAIYGSHTQDLQILGRKATLGMPCPGQVIER